MEQRRFLLAIALSILILLGFQWLMPPHPAVQHAAGDQPKTQVVRDTPSLDVAPASPGNLPAPEPVPQNVPRVPISAPRVEGSINLLGARLDDLKMRDYRETAAPSSPPYPLLLPRSDAQPSWVQFGWSSDQAGIKLPGLNTVWTGSDGPVSPGHPATLRWDNGAGLGFQIVIAIDDNYMFSVQQSVTNHGTALVALHPWARLRRDYTPTDPRSNFHEGPIGVLGGRLQEITYAKARQLGAEHDGVAFSATGTGGWAGITDKYMLTALVPDQAGKLTAQFRALKEGAQDGYQVDFVADVPQTVAPGGEAVTQSHLFAGAKEARLLNHYESADNIPLFSYAIDYGWLWFLTKPFYAILDVLNGVLGNFVLAILSLTVVIKLLLLPVVNRSYRSMSKMQLLKPKLDQLRERYKDDPPKMMQETMALYKAEGVSPMGGILPVLFTAPVFFALYKVISVDIGVWHVPLFGWIHDLSMPDPTNVFNLFGLIPWDPTHVSPLLHLGVWPIVLGVTMYLQQMFNPPPGDPAQARMFRMMPVVFAFFLGRFPAALIVYYCWSNILTVGQQWLIRRNTHLAKPRMART